MKLMIRKLKIMMRNKMKNFKSPLVSHSNNNSNCNKWK